MVPCVTLLIECRLRFFALPLFEQDVFEKLRDIVLLWDVGMPTVCGPAFFAPASTSLQCHSHRVR